MFQKIWPTAEYSGYLSNLREQFSYLMYFMSSKEFYFHIVSILLPWYWWLYSLSILILIPFLI